MGFLNSNGLRRLWAHIVLNLDKKANIDHKHDDLYYTKTNVDAQDAATLQEAQAYTDTEIALLLNNSSEAVDSIMELAAAMEENEDVVDALEQAIGGKADIKHNHDDIYYTEAEVDGLISNLNEHIDEQINTAVSYTVTQTATDEQKNIARTNISAAKSTIVQVGDTEPTDEATEIWINTAEDWEDNAAAKVHKHDFTDITISDIDAVKAALDIDEGIVLENLTAIMPSSSKWYDIAYGDGVYIAIAYNSNVAARSYDGITWESINMPISAQWSTMAYGNGTFVVFAGSIAYRTVDAGTTWTSCSGIGYSCYAVKYANEKFVAIGDKDHVLYSADGVTWQSTTIPNNSSWKNLTYGNGKFVAVGSAYNDVVSAYSTDGVNWTAGNLSTAKNWQDVAYGNGVYVAISGGTFQCQSAVSVDGINWTTYTRPSNNQWFNITYGNGMFVALGANGVYAYSTDGITWTESVMPSTKSWYAVIYVNNKFITMENGGNIIVFSTDGITWQADVTAIMQSGEDVTSDFLSVLSHTHDEYIKAPTATVGQMIRVAGVDSNNKPTAWEAFDLNYEEWTFELEDGTTVTKQVAVSV